MDSYYNVLIEDFFGVSSSRLDSGLVQSVHSPPLTSNSNLSCTNESKVFLHIGPCLVEWTSKCDSSDSNGVEKANSNCRLVRSGLKRLHHDSIMHIYALSNQYCVDHRYNEANWHVSASYHGELRLWPPGSLFSETPRYFSSWEAYSNDMKEFDLPCLYMAWNHEKGQLATVSGPKNPNLQPKPTDDTISPTLPAKSRISVWDLSFAAQLQQQPENMEYLARRVTPNRTWSFDLTANGEVMLAWVKPENSPSPLLASLIVDAKRDHVLLLLDPHGTVNHHIDPDSPNEIGIATRFDIPGNSITYYSATPDGKALVVLKGKFLQVLKPKVTEADGKRKIDLDMVFSGQLTTESDLSPFSWDTIASSASSSELYGYRFRSMTSNGNLHTFLITQDFKDVLLIQKQHLPSAHSSSPLYSLIYNPKHSGNNYSELYKISMTSLEITRFAEPEMNGVALDNPLPMEIISEQSCMLHGLTCCGVDFDPSGQFLAVGDWTGLITIWNVKRSPSASTPFTELRVPHAMIRSLKFCPVQHHQKESDVFTFSITAGDTSGRLFECAFDAKLVRINESAAEWELVKVRNPTYHRNSGRTITSLQWRPQPSAIGSSSSPNAETPQAGHGTFLASGDTNGFLKFYARKQLAPSSDVQPEFHEDRDLTCVMAFQAHQQQPHVASHEIWTLAFSPDGKSIATGSEDFSVHVYSIPSLFNTPQIPILDHPHANLELIATLEGPKAAVTSVDWQTVDGFGSVLVAASDDRTIHCWKFNEENKSFSLIHVFRTNWEHLMITYLALDSGKGSGKIYCSTMAGYVYVFDLNHTSQRTKCKVHLGSLEGLALNRNGLSHQIAVCSSDCTASLLSISPKALRKYSSTAIIQK